MLKIIAVIFMFLFNSIATAEEKATELPPIDESYFGSHPMVLFIHSSKIFAYPFPGYKKPHDVQVLYKLDVKNLALVQLVRDAQFVTIVPEKFNIQRLMRGEKLTITADVYMGHYAQGGDKTYTEMPLSFAKQIYAREMKELEPSGRIQTYDKAEYSKSENIYIHRIQQAPSFDHILMIDETASCAKRFATSSATPKEQELLFKFVNCGSMKPLYFSTDIKN